jgi:hypothetical protein
MGSARRSTQAKLDRQLEQLGERIGELLSQLGDMERMALTCWRDGIMPNTYEVDHQAITDRPYVSIRRVERWDEEYEIDELKAMQSAEPEPAAIPNSPLYKGRLKKFIDKLNERL